MGDRYVAQLYKQNLFILCCLVPASRRLWGSRGAEAALDSCRRAPHAAAHTSWRDGVEQVMGCNVHQMMFCDSEMWRFRQMSIILSVGLKGSAAELHRWFSRSYKKLIETFFLLAVCCVATEHRVCGLKGWLES